MMDRLYENGDAPGEDRSSVDIVAIRTEKKAQGVIGRSRNLRTESGTGPRSVDVHARLLD